MTEAEQKIRTALDAWNEDDGFRERADAMRALRSTCRPSALREMFAEIDALRADAVPDGWVLVPIEPSDEQLRAALAAESPAMYGAFLRHPANGKKISALTEAEIIMMRKQYAAMLAAAPIKQGSEP